MGDLLEKLAQLNPVTQALLATLFTWGVTAAGASLVFFVHRENRRVLDIMLGFAAGVMIAASFWSLLAPAIEMSEGGRFPVWFPAAVGFGIGLDGVAIRRPGYLEIPGCWWRSSDRPLHRRTRLSRLAEPNPQSCHGRRRSRRSSFPSHFVSHPGSRKP